MLILFNLFNSVEAALSSKQRYKYRLIYVMNTDRI